MIDKANVEIDADKCTATLSLPEQDVQSRTYLRRTTKAELIATILMIQARGLMAMSKEQLMDMHMMTLKL